jgi:hypothetical protein
MEALGKREHLGPQIIEPTCALWQMHGPGLDLRGLGAHAHDLVALRLDCHGRNVLLVEILVKAGAGPGIFDEDRGVLPPPLLIDLDDLAPERGVVEADWRDSRAGWRRSPTFRVWKRPKPISMD